MLFLFDCVPERSPKFWLLQVIIFFSAAHAVNAYVVKRSVRTTGEKRDFFDECMFVVQFIGDRARECRIDRSVLETNKNSKVLSRKFYFHFHFSENNFR